MIKASIFAVFFLLGVLGGYYFADQTAKPCPPTVSNTISGKVKVKRNGQLDLSQVVNQEVATSAAGPDSLSGRQKRQLRKKLRRQVNQPFK